MASDMEFRVITDRMFRLYEAWVEIADGKRYSREIGEATRRGTTWTAKVYGAGPKAKGKHENLHAAMLYALEAWEKQVRIPAQQAQAQKILQRYTEVFREQLSLALIGEEPQW